MSLDAKQLRILVVRPALKHIDLWSREAENLVMGTAAQESNLRYLAQIRGPAVSLWQIEPRTYADMWENWIGPRTELRTRLRELAGYPAATPPCSAMYGNLFFAAAMCRVYYRRIPSALPAHDDVVGMANYWKRYYNTHLGRGKPSEFIRNYRLTV